jgi:anaerobic magnesium-protoporphyrin IX monomethyl ester cyclase
MNAAASQWLQIADQQHRPVPDRIDRARPDTSVVDCLLIGFNDTNFDDYVDMINSMGPASGAYQDVRLAFVEIDGKRYRALDLLNRFHQGAGRGTRFHNADFMWPVITYLGSFLASHGFTFDYVNLFHLERDELRRKLTEKNIRTIAITTTLYVSAEPILEIVSFIRRYNRTAKIIVGGPHIGNQIKTAAGDDLQAVLGYLGGDIYVISSEGEQTLTRVLAALDAGRDLGEIPNIAFRDGDRYVLTYTDPEANRLEQNMINYGVFPASAFNEFVTTRTAKSCPFSCAFCGFPQRAGRYTYMDLELVRAELDAIKALPSVSTVTFIDDTFNVPKVRFRELLRMMIDRQYGFKWNCFYRSDHGDEQTIRLMKEAGCEGVFLGIESGSDLMLKHMNKTARRKDYMEALRVFREVGICTHASLIIGFPCETEETVAATVSLIEEGKPDFFRAQLWYCDPVTPIWQKREEYGIEGEAFSWRHNTMDSDTACRIIDTMFTSIRNSIWLPQFGFEQWSVFYLQRRGMPMEQVKALVRSFNALVADQIASGDTGQVNPELLARFQQNCRFDAVLPGPREAVGG